MVKLFSTPKNSIRPYEVHFIFDSLPTNMLVLARSPCHAVQVMFRYFEIVGELHKVTYLRSDPHCSVLEYPYFSDSLYKHYKNK